MHNFRRTIARYGNINNCWAIQFFVTSWHKKKTYKNETTSLTKEGEDQDEE